MNLDTIVKINITRQTKQVTRAGFGTALALFAGITFNDVVRTYEDAASVQEDDEVPAAVKTFATKYFGQTLQPTKLVIGKRTAKVAQVETVTVVSTADGSKTVTINGVEYEFVANANTATQIRAGLVAAINAGTEPVTAANHADVDKLTLTADVAGNSFTSVLGAGLTKVTTAANNGVIEDLAIAMAENDDWYALALESRNADDILNAASVIEADKKIFVACSADADILTGVDTDVASKLKSKSYSRTALIYSDDQESFPEAAWLGGRLPTDPGSSTWKFKTLAGITADKLTSTQETNLKAKNANYYVTVGGVSITVEGKMAVGEFIDIIHFVDWLEARMKERIYSTLVNAEKIPFTDGGIAVVETDVRAQLQQGIDVGGLDSFTVTVPKRSQTQQADRAARTLKGIKFNGVLAGAIHFVEVQGNVTV